ncbi:Rpn family recombination-promoting nuclease/putative transposase [Lachnospiraceae bacterium]|nr:Rpn family recombination-promoting nuclease/putative transposase [Lachnospiraceae bacterium]
MIQDSKIVEQIVDDMDLFDDDLMSMVFDRNIPATELLLRIILKQGDITVISVVSQCGFQNPIVGGRDIRLDILAKDSTGRYYNIEVQKKPEGAHVRRARFNSSMMDVRMLKAGQEFSELRDSYMVFITQTDIFGHGLPVYTVNRHFEEIEDSFNDGSHIVYVNGSYKGEDAIGKLMHDFGCKESKDIYYPELAEGVKHFKEEGGRKIMCEAVEKYAQSYAEKYAQSYAEKYAETKRIDALYEVVKNLMETMKLNAEQAMSAIKISENDKEVLLKRL